MSIALVATITPGPAALLVSTHSVCYGPTKTISTIFGNLTGIFLMSLLSVMGLSTIILYSTTGFFIVKMVGATYLIYVGIKLWRNGLGFNSVHSDIQQPKKQIGLKNLYFQGVLVALTNPKAIAFTTALFPQFIQANEPIIYQFGLLVATFMSCSFFCLSSYAMLAVKASNKLRPMKQQEIGKVFGSTFIGAGVVLAMQSNK